METALSPQVQGLDQVRGVRRKASEVGGSMSVRKVEGGEVCQGSVGDEEHFELDYLLNGQAMEVWMDWGDPFWILVDVLCRTQLQL